MQTREWKSLDYSEKMIRIEIDVFESTPYFDKRITITKESRPDFNTNMTTWLSAEISITSCGDMTPNMAADFAQALYKATCIVAVLDHEYPAGTKS